MRTINREGFWWSKQEIELPRPIPNVKPWRGQKLFLEHLLEIERTAPKMLFRGFSVCRLCNQHNGSSEYVLENWHWPVGFKHYVEEHNVRPSLAFQEFIMQMKLTKDQTDEYRYKNTKDKIRNRIRI